MTATALGDDAKKEFVGLTTDQVPWFTPSYYKDGRQRAQMLLAGLLQVLLPG